MAVLPGTGNVTVHQLWAEYGSGFSDKFDLKYLALLNLNIPSGTPKHQLNGYNF